MIGNARKTAGRGQRRNSSVTRYPAPLKGIDLSQSVSAENLEYCIYTYNLCPFEYGLRVRKGFREWQINVDAGTGAGVHTLIPFDSVTEGATDDKLFAITNEGIWDVTNFDETPVQMVVFPDQDPDAGYGTFTHYVNQAEDDVLFYADNINGLYSYDAGTQTWTNSGILTGLAEADVKFVMSHKNNVWFAAKDSTIGYYLPILSASGQVTEQFFGDKFKHGGALEGLFSWTVDGGAGVDDILVAVSHAGDVIVYTGDGPEAENWGMKGIYFIGEIPNTPRFGSEQGGELYLLSAFGVSSMSDLLTGVDTAELQAGLDGTSMSFKIAGIIREVMKAKISLRGWDVALVPTEGAMLISVPTVGGEAPIQFYYNLGTRGWGFWRGVPMQCFTEYLDSIYFGTVEGRVMKMDVPVDNLLLNPVDVNTNGDDIEFSILSSFTSLGAQGVYKRVKLIRPDFTSNRPLSHASQARFDYDLAEGDPFVLQDPAADETGLWDTSDWDSAVWGSRLPTPKTSIAGTWGYGRYVAIATRGSCRADTRLIGWDIIYDVGGPLL